MNDLTTAIENNIMCMHECAIHKGVLKDIFADCMPQNHFLVKLSDYSTSNIDSNHIVIILLLNKNTNIEENSHTVKVDDSDFNKFYAEDDTSESMLVSTNIKELSLNHRNTYYLYEIIRLLATASKSVIT